MTVNLNKQQLEKLKRKAYRQAYVAEHVKTGVAYQVREMRDDREWSQKHLAETMDKPQSVVSRIEDPEYGKLTLQTLLEVASAFDVALLVQFVSFGEFIARTKDVSPAALNAPSFNESEFEALPLSTGQTITNYSDGVFDINIIDYETINYIDVPLRGTPLELVN